MRKRKNEDDNNSTLLYSVHNTVVYILRHSCVHAVNKIIGLKFILTVSTRKQLNRKTTLSQYKILKVYLIRLQRYRDYNI